MVIPRLTGCQTILGPAAGFLSEWPAPVRQPDRREPRMLEEILALINELRPLPRGPGPLRVIIDKKRPINRNLRIYNAL